MEESFTTPSSLESLKRHAKQLKKEHGIKHHAALEMAAILAGFGSFRHFCSQESVDSRSPKRENLQRPSAGADRVKMTITLLDVNPAVWRVFDVPTNISMDALHDYIQIIMGWKNAHLWDFIVPGMKRITSDVSIEDDHDYPDNVHLGQSIKLLDIINDQHFDFGYHYDFGDNWKHHIQIERSTSKATQKQIIKVISGSVVCPPEDCGGFMGYNDLVEILENPDEDDMDYQDIKDWLEPSFDPFAKFDKAKAQSKINKLIGNRSNSSD